MGNKMKVNQIKIGAILSYISIGISLLVFVIYTPIMRNSLGQSEYGLYNLSASVINSLSLLNLGISGAYLRYYTIYKSESNKIGLSKLNGLFFIMFAIIAVVTLLTGITLSQFPKQIFGSELTNTELNKAKLITIILSINLFFSMITTPFFSFINANERFVWQKSLNIVQTLIGPFITFPVILLTKKYNMGSVAFAAATAFIGISIQLINVLYAFKKGKIQFEFKNLEIGILKELLIFSFWIFVYDGFQKINYNMGSYFIGRFLGTSVVAIYTVAYSLESYFEQFSTSFTQVFYPKIYSLVEKNKRDITNTEITKFIAKLSRIQFIILMLFYLGFIFFGTQFISWWGANYIGIEESYFISLILLSISVLVSLQIPTTVVVKAKNKYYFLAILQLISALINLIISIFLIRHLGAIGASIGLFITLFFMLVIRNFIYHYIIHLDMIYFWKNILKFIPAMIFPIIFGIIYTNFVDVSKISSFLFGIVFFTLIYTISMWIFALNKYEKNTIMAPLKLLFRKN